MSTNAKIAIHYKTEMVKSIYCHFDGYIKHTGEILFKKYNNLEAAEEMIMHGDMSQLGEDYHSTPYYVKSNGGDHQEVESEIYPNCDKFTNSNPSYFYLYLFKEEDNCWYVRKPESTFKRLEEFV